MERRTATERLSAFLEDRQRAWQALREARAGRHQSQVEAKRLAADHFAHTDAYIGPFGPCTVETRAPDATQVLWLDAETAEVQLTRPHTPPVFLLLSFVDSGSDVRIRSAVRRDDSWRTPILTEEQRQEILPTAAAAFPHILLDDWPSEVQAIWPPTHTLYAGDLLCQPSMLARVEVLIAEPTEIRVFEAHGTVAGVCVGSHSAVVTWHPIASFGVDSGTLTLLHGPRAESLTAADARVVARSMYDRVRVEPGVLITRSGQGDGRYNGYVGLDLHGTRVAFLVDFTGPPQPLPEAPSSQPNPSVPPGPEAMSLADKVGCFVALPFVLFMVAYCVAIGMGWVDT
jgi:hypothetical protein